MRASDLPESTKKQILRSIQDKMGEARYRETLEALGEDGIIAAILNAGPAAESKPTRRTAGQKVGGFIRGALIVAVITVMAFGFLWAAGDFKHWYSKVVAGVCLVPWLMFLNGFTVPTKDYRPSFFDGLIIFACVVLVVWGAIQGLVGLF
jgi:type IV secretory pathway VirB2 component (pilin)